MSLRSSNGLCVCLASMVQLNLMCVGRERGRREREVRERGWRERGEGEGERKRGEVGRERECECMSESVYGGCITHSTYTESPNPYRSTVVQESWSNGE